MINSNLKRVLALVLCLSMLFSCVAVAETENGVQVISEDQIAKITKQPKSIAVEEGATAKVSLTATGDGLIYNWYFKNPGASSFAKTDSFKGNSYSVKMDSARDGRQVYCVVMDAYGNVAKSNTVTLSMVKPVSITKQPVSVTVQKGETAKVSLTASGNGLIYNWYFKNKGASSFSKTSSFTGNSYSVAMDSTRDGRQVYCVVMDAYGNVAKSNTVTLSMQATSKVEITKQPVNVSVFSGETAKVSFTAKGDGLTYEWYFKNAGASSFSKTSSFTGNSYSVKMDSTRAGRQVYCKVTDQYGNSVKTNTVTLGIKTKAAITKQPVSVTVADGETAKVSFTAKGDGLTYEWYFKNAGASSFSKTTSFKGNTYSVAMSDARSGRQVYCKVTDQYGNSVTTNTVTLSKKVSLAITKQPVSVTVAEGETAKVSFTATGDGLTYEWYFKNPGASSFSKTTSFKGNTYSVAMSDARSGRQVYCKVTDQHGNSVTTNTVTLSMKVSLAITKQPVSVKVQDGEKATVSFTATGSGLTYEWYFKNAGASSFSKTTSFKGNSYYVTMSADRSGRQVYCKVTDGNGNSVKTNTVTLSMATPLAINQQPVSASAANGEVVKVTVGAQGEGLTYAWYFKAASAEKFSLTTSYKGNSYSVEMNDSRNGRQVYCVVSDQYGNSVKSDVATLSMETAVTDFEYTVDTKNECVTIKKYVGNGGKVSVPSTIEGYPVCYIGDSAFQNKDLVTAVTLPSGLLSIGYKAFNDCGVLSSISIPTTCGYIGTYAFQNCDALRTVSLGSVTSMGDHAFEGCDALSSVTVPGTLSKISKYAFKDCSALSSVTIRSGVTTIGSEAFYNCDALGSITIPATVSTIDTSAFAGCDGLRSVTLNSGLTGIGDYAFDDCSLLKSISIPGTCTYVGKYAFENCDMLSSVTVKSGVKQLSYSAFRDCDALSSISIPASVTSVGDYCFQSCNSLGSVTFASGSGASIGSYAFNACPVLSSLTLPSNGSSLGEFSFQNCDALTSVTIPGSFGSIRQYAFRDCDALATVKINSGITSIATYAFEGCGALSSLTLPDTLLSTGYRSFADCSSLTTLKLPNGMTTVGQLSFAGCKSISSITIPNSVITINGEAFSGCSGATSLKIGSGVTQIAGSAFENCTGLSTLTIPGNVLSIGDYAFRGCTGLTRITINEGTNSLGYYTFRDCKNVATVTLPESLVTIRDVSFQNCPATFYVYSGSYAYNWCVKYGKSYEMR